MPIPVFISTAAINRMINKVYASGLLPGIEGRLGRWDFLHACYSVRITGLPTVMTDKAGILSLRIPMDGKVSIPWGMGLEFSLDAIAAMAVDILDDRVEVELAGLEFQDLRMGKGCPMPREISRLIGPAVKGAIVQFMGGTGRLSFPLPPFEIPLFELAPDAPPTEMHMRDVVVIEQGMLLLLGSKEGDLTDNPWIPPTEGRDLVLAISEGEAERLIAKALEGPGNEITGTFDIPMADPKMALDLVRASGETLTSFGRRGLGRRSLVNTTRIKVHYGVNTGAPHLRIHEDGNIEASDAPAHLQAKAVLEQDVPKEKGIIRRMANWFRPGATRDPSEYETIATGQWDVDEDIRIVKVNARVGNDAVGRPKWSIVDLDIDLDLPWPLPEKIIESIAGNIGTRIATSLLPTDLPEEIALPMDIPFKLRMKGMELLTLKGELAIRADVDIEAVGDVDAARASIEGVFRSMVPPSLIGQPAVSWK